MLKLEVKSQGEREPMLTYRARKHLTQMRMAVCYCLNSKESRQKRLTRALDELMQSSYDISLPTANAHWMWTAELTYRLSDELAGHGDFDYLNKLAVLSRKATLGLASQCRSTSEFHTLLRQFCDLTFRIGVPLQESAEWGGWKTSVQRSLDNFRIDAANTRTTELTAEDEDRSAGEVAEDILLLVRAAVFQNSEVLSKWLEQHRMMPILVTGALANDDVQELFQTLLVIARAHAMRSQVVDPFLRETLGVLREIELRRQMQYAHLQQFDPYKPIEVMRERLELMGKGELTSVEQARLEELVLISNQN